MTETIAELNARLERIRINDAKARVRSQQPASAQGKRDTITKLSGGRGTMSATTAATELTDEQLASEMVKQYRGGGVVASATARAAAMSADERYAHDAVQRYLRERAK